MPKEPIIHSRSSNGTPLYKCVCPDCGTVRVADKRKLTKPCHPCAMRRRRTHGLASGTMHPLYKVLRGMRIRCEYASASSYRYYGGRGIRVCAQWREDPRAFVAWAEAEGWQPGLEVDRVDLDGDYTPENCRIVTHRVNSQSRRNSSMMLKRASVIREALERGATVKQASERFGVSYMVVWHLRNSPDVWRAS